MKKVYIYNAKRSPVGKFKKTLHNTDCCALGTQVVKSLFNKDINEKNIDKLICGNVIAAGVGQNIARQISLSSGIEENKCAMVINMLCGSGLKAINLAYNDIVLGNSNCIIAGGVENMSRTPYLKDKYTNEESDSLFHDALIDTYTNEVMGITAERIAKTYNISREEQDNFAYLSQMRTKKAIEDNKFIDEIVPITTSEGILFDKDEFPRPDTTLEKLAELKPSFDEFGTVTAGNSSGVNDGASFVIVGDDTINAKPLAEIVAFSEIGCDPKLMGMGAYYSIVELLNKTNIDINDIDLFEINEAFASQFIAVIDELCKKYSLDKEEFLKRINVNGGSIALGHAVGSTGSRILTTLIYEMKKRKALYGVVSLCIGGGQGIAALIKNVED